MPGGIVLWQGGPLPSKEPQTVAFTRSYARAGRQELRLWGWSLTGGSLWLNGDKLGDLPLSDPEVLKFLRGALRERGLRQAAKFRWDTMARETVEVYREVRQRRGNE